MRLARFVGCVTGLILLTACQGTSMALMGEPEESTPVSSAEETTEVALAPDAIALPLSNAVLPPKRPKDLPNEPNEQDDETPAATTEAPPAPPQSQPSVSTAQASPSQSGYSSLPETEEEVVERANSYFNHLTVLSGRFTQTSSNGQMQQGKLYLQRPGKVRFEYDAPSNLDIVSDGSKVAIRDKRMGTQNLYSISQTPLKFLLNDNVRLDRDLKLLGAGLTAKNAVIIVEDRSTLGGTSRITLYFDPSVSNLQRWEIEDTQRTKTSVSLSSLDRSRRPDPSVFVIR